MRFFCAALIILFIFPAVAFAAENGAGLSNPNINLPEPDSSYASAVNPVSVDEFQAKISRILDHAVNLSGGILVQVAVLMMVISAFITAAGWLFRLSGPKDLGIRGLVMSSFGLLIFWSIPFIVRMINSVASILNS